MIGREIRFELDAGMDVSTFKPGQRQSAVAIDSEGQLYRGAGFNSETHLLSVEAPAAALYSAAMNQNYDVNHLVIMYEGDFRGINPIMAQVMIDFAARTGQTMSVSVVNTHGWRVCVPVDVHALAPYYHGPGIDIPDFVRDTYPVVPPTGKMTTLNVSMLKSFAVAGMSRAFLTSDRSTRYGAAVRSADGRVFFGGQYSSFDHRTNIHAEMGATMLAKLEGVTEVTDLGLISTKFADPPARMCGCCRQFAVEATPTTDLMVHTFGMADGITDSQPLSTYLPDVWSSQHGN